MGTDWFDTQLSLDFIFFSNISHCGLLGSVCWWIEFKNKFYSWIVIRIRIRINVGIKVGIRIIVHIRVKAIGLPTQSQQAPWYHNYNVPIITPCHTVSTIAAIRSWLKWWNCLSGISNIIQVLNIHRQNSNVEREFEHLLIIKFCTPTSSRALFNTNNQASSTITGWTH